jgi:tetratricopeptide (TPR) repeat protein
MAKFRVDLSVILALALLTAAVYGQVIGHEFVSYDDPSYITENEIVRNGLTREGFVWAFSAFRASNWHPLTWLSHMLDVEIFGLKSGGHHLVNVFLHIVNTALLFAVLRRMTGALWCSAFVAALFALHPLHVESVAWVSERKDVLSTFFLILTIGVYLRYTRSPGIATYWPVVVFFALGLLAKPMLVTLPVVLLLLDYWPLGRLQTKEVKPADPVETPLPSGRRGKKQNRQPREKKKTPSTDSTIGWKRILPLLYEKMPLLALSAVSSCITVYAQLEGGAVASISALPVHERVANAFVAYVAYLWKMVWPARLVYFYPLEPLSPLTVIASAFLLVVMTFLSLRWAEKRPYLAIGWLWYLVTLLPVIGFIQVGSAAMADRYTYVPLMGPFIALAWGFSDLSQALRLPKAFTALASALVVAACMLASYVQVSYWQDGFTLARRALEVNERNYAAHSLLATEYMKQKNYGEALPHLKRALEINRRVPETNMNMGIVQYYSGDYAGAHDHFIAVIGLKPNYYEAFEWLGKTYLATGQIDKALNQFRLAVQLDRDNSAAYGGMGEVLIEQNRLAEALQYTLLAIKGQPNNQKLHNNLGFIFIRQGKFAEAIPWLQEAVRLAPDYARAHSNLGGALVEVNRIDEAIHHFQEAIRLDPGNQTARENLKYALSKRRK